VVALIGLGIALSQQDVVDLLIVPAIVTVAAVYYALFLRPRRSTHWRDPEDVPRMETPTTETRQAGNERAEP